MSARVKITTRRRSNGHKRKIDLSTPVTFVNGKEAQRYKCGICLHTIKKAVALCDDHVFCEQCVEQLMEHNTIIEEPNIVACPICRERCNVILVKRCKFIDRRIKDLITKCPNHQITTQKALYLQQTDAYNHNKQPSSTHNHNNQRNHNHERSSRSRSRSRSRERNDAESKNNTRSLDIIDSDDMNTKECKLDICDWLGPFSRLQQHINECPLHILQCEYCLELIMRDQSEMHQYLCPKGMVSCTHCRHKIKRESYRNHYAECLEVHIECSYEPYGCPATFKRKQEKKHMDESMSVHLDMICYSHRDLEEQVKGLKYTLNQMQKRHTKDCDALLQRIGALELEYSSSEYEEEDDSDESVVT